MIPLNKAPTNGYQAPELENNPSAQEKKDYQEKQAKAFYREAKLSVSLGKNTLSRGPMLSLPGVYCLRSNQTQWSEEQLWRTYMMLTEPRSRVSLL